MANKKLKFIFMGTPEFGAIVLELLIKNDYKPCLVVAAPDKSVSGEKILTPEPVKKVAQKYQISILQPLKIKDAISEIQNTGPDLIIVAAYGQILPKEILGIPKYSCLKVHPSLLPKYRGPTPIQYAILNGEKETGATIMLMGEKVDAGPILSQRVSIVEKDETSNSLCNKLANLGGKLLIETIPRWIRGVIKTYPQDEEKAIYTKILTREDGKIKWQKIAEKLEREVRAFDPWPGSYTFWERKAGWGRKAEKSLKIKILKASVLKSSRDITYPVGKTLVAQDKVCVQCGKGFPFLSGGKDFLIIEKLQLEGKKPMVSEEFLRDYRDFIGITLK